MITVMRRYLKGLHLLLFAVIAIFIATSVFVWGKVSPDDSPAGGQTVAVVNGESISYERFRHAYQAAVSRYSQMYQGRFTPQMAEQLGLSQQVLNELVQEAVVVQRARAEGLRVTDQEVNVQIYAIPAFHEGGVFSIRRYDDVLQRLRITKAAFEDDVRHKLLLRKVAVAVTGGVKVSDAEVEQTLAYRNEMARAAWASVPVAPLLERAEAPEGEVDAYYQQHREEFRRPERRRIQYVAFEQKDLPAVTDAEVAKYYEDHSAEFGIPAQIQVAHILARVPETGGSQAEQTARAKIQEAIRRARGGEDFAAIARQVSEDPESAARGGELGWVTKGALVPQFERAAFALKKGEVSSEPVRTPFGYHAIKVIDSREAVHRTLKEVTPQIRAKLLTQQLERAAADRARQARPALQAAGDFTAAARQLGLEPRAMSVSRPPGPPALARLTPIQEATFALAVGGVSEPTTTPNGPVIIKVLEHLPEGVPPLAEVREEVATAVKRQKADAVALARARQLAAAARSGDLVRLARKEGLQAGVTAAFSRSKPAEQIPPEVAIAALRQLPGAVAEPVKTAQGYYVMKTLERLAPDPAVLAKERESAARELLETKRSQAWESWVSKAREGAKVEFSERIPTPAS
jgi:peptidyl-prolyl cis-trans isomerase D